MCIDKKSAYSAGDACTAVGFWLGFVHVYEDCQGFCEMIAALTLSAVKLIAIKYMSNPTGVSTLKRAEYKRTALPLGPA